MKKLIFAFILLLFAVWLGFLIHRDPGYILITYHDWSVETSLWIGILILIIIFGMFYLLMRLFRHTSRLGINLQTWNRERRERKASELTNQAFEALIEMNWRKAEDLFAKSAKDSICSAINYTAAAFAAQQLIALDRRNKYLTKLFKQSRTTEKTAKLVESYFYLQSGQWKEALQTIHVLKQKYPQDPAVIRFTVKALEGLNDWETLKTLLPQMSKHLDITEYKKLETDIYRTLLKKAIHPEMLDQIWETISKAQRSNVEIAATYAIKAAELRRDNEAVNVIENALKKNWNDTLIECYGKLNSDYTGKQISHAETWLKKYPQNPTLLICLGRLCLKEKLWGKAQDYLQQAIDLDATSDAYHELGRLYEATDDTKSALKHFKKASKLTNHHF